MTSLRPYRQPFSVAEALAELRRHAGTKLDPACVEALASAVASGELSDLLPTEKQVPQPCEASPLPA